MAFIEGDTQKVLKERFDQEMDKRVKILFFSDELNCQYCPQIKSLLEEVKGYTDKLDVEEHNFFTQKALVEQYKLDGSPALVFLDSEGKDTGIRIYGIPAGHEFASFIEAICLVSSGKTKTLPAKVREEIEKIDSPLEIKVFVTTTCPYCAGAVITAHEMAFVNPHITGKMIESMEFPEWAGKHNVYTVPKIIINDKVEFEGAVPVKEYAKKVIEAHHAGEKKLIILP